MSFLIASQRECTSKDRQATYFDYCKKPFAVASCGVSLDGCSTSLPKSSVVPLGSVVVAQRTMASTWLSTCLSALKITQLSPDATEMPLSKVMLTLASPMSSSHMTVADVRQAMEDAQLLPPAVKVCLFFKDEEGDFVALPSLEVTWPSCCISDCVLKAWFMCVPERVATTPSTPVCTCLGPHAHQPPKKKLATLDEDEFQGYSMLAAAGDGCASCVAHWLQHGVDPNYESGNCAYTAMDFVLWAEKKSHISAASAKQLREMLAAAGGRANKM